MTGERNWPSEAEIKAAEDDLKDCPPEIRRVMLDLVKAGKIVDSGRRENGAIVWVAYEFRPHH
jgi:hypothetical protein